MDVARRSVIAGALALAARGSEEGMCGLIGKMIAKTGQHGTLEARPLIEGFGERFVTPPLGGVGLG